VVISAGPHFYPVRQVHGQTPDQARATLLSAGEVSVAPDVNQESSDSVPEGRVTRTAPKAGTEIKASQPITIYVSTGPPVLNVPNIPPGTPVSDAESTLKKAHFKTTTDNQYSDSIGKDEVISISPSDHARKDSTITLQVSKGPEMVNVPNIAVGSPVSDAKNAITQAGLLPEVRTFPGGGSGQTPSNVIDVEPKSGTSVHVGSTVVLYAIQS
jgi:serine/threonine-protein kinase